MIPNWIQLRGKRLQVCFDTAAQAEAFLLTQSVKPEWLAQFTLEYNVAYGKLQCIITTEFQVTLHLNTEQLNTVM